MANIAEGNTTRIRFNDPATLRPRHWAVLIPGNGQDIISDWGDDQGPFVAAVNDFVDAI